MSRRNKISVILILLALFVTIFLIVRFAVNLKVEDMSFVSQERGTVFDIYEVDMEKMGDMYYVYFKDVVASAADMPDKKYFRTDITLVVNDRKLANSIVGDKTMAVARMRNTMSTFRTIDVRDPRGKRFFKERIRRELSAVYSTEGITDIYFNKFVHD